MPRTDPTPRQQVILECLRLAGGRASRQALTKWLFLLAHETEWGRLRPPYDFVPYHYGPFSFVAYDDLRALATMGILEQADDSVRVAARPRLTLDSSAKSAIGSVMDRYGCLALEDLLAYVYRTYPWYAVLSKRGDLAPADRARPKGDTKVYTIGYAGRSIDGFLDLLLRTGLSGIVDVRDTPWSRSFGFSRGPLTGHLEKLDLAYVPCPDLGVPSGERRASDQAASRAMLLQAYRTRIEQDNPAVLGALCNEVSARPLALMCMEARPEECHRSALAEVVAQRTGLSVRHL